MMRTAVVQTSLDNFVYKAEREDPMPSTCAEYEPKRLNSKYKQNKMKFQYTQMDSQQKIKTIKRMAYIYKQPQSLSPKIVTLY
jgi:hypothetical protein